MMRGMQLTLAGLMLFGAVATLSSQQAPPAKDAAQPKQNEQIDFERARALLRKRQSGEKLTPDEQAYLEKAQAARRAAGNAARPNAPRPNASTRAIFGKEQTGFKPLTEMTAEDRYEGQDGGLYGAGQNSPPDAHRKAAEAELARIQPLDREGKPAADGRIVFVSISMSNATQEFSTFKRIADNDRAKSSRLTIVDCAQGGQAMAEWVNPDAGPWKEADRRLAAAQVTHPQVQVAWIKLANKGPTGTLEQHGKKLERDTQAVIANAKARFPNLRIAYLSSRIYGGYTMGPLNPEPYAYESAFVCRWLIQDQIKGNPELNYDSAKGPVKAPLLLWGPYLWADGTKPRAGDGLAYLRDDLRGDGTHPSDAGRDKVARLMLSFYTTDPLAKSWFTK
jgi:hypothetical protein